MPDLVRSPEASPRGWLLRLCAGPLIWASCFVTLYAGLSLGCEADWQERSIGGLNLLTVTLAMAWAAHLGFIAGLLRRQWHWREANGTLTKITPVLLAVALVGTLWIGWPVFVLPPCVGTAA